MNEDAAFIRAIREQPDDETARLVYADWLDERSDPRAEYLRAEATWVALRPSDEQYRTLYRRASRLAAPLDPEWFAAVGRMGILVGRAWEALPIELKPETPLVPNRLQIWKETVAPLRALFAEGFGSEEVALRFCLPADFMAFQCVVDKHRWDYSGETLLEVAEEHVREFGPLQRIGSAERRTAKPEMWLEFGLASDDSWYFVCCDRGSPRFGTVAEGFGDHPWEAGSESLRFCGRNFLQYIAEHLPATVALGGYSWPHVPFDRWTTY